MMKSTRSVVVGMTMMALAALGVVGCTKTGVSNTTTSAITYVTVINTATYSPATDIFFNGTKLTTAPIPAVNYSTSYSPLPPNAYDVQFRVGGGDSIMAEIPSSRYDSAQFTTLIMYNNTVNGPAKAVKIVDDFTTLSLSGSNYRFFNLCPDFPSVDLFFNGNLVMGSRTVADNVTNSMYNAFLPVTGSTYTITVKPAGKDSILTQLIGVTLAQQNVYTIFLSGKPGSATNPVAINVLRAAY